MKPIKLCCLVLSASLVLPALVQAWNDTPIETELAASQTYLSIIDVAPARTAGALVKPPDLGGDELVRIDYKPKRRDSNLSRLYWLRNGKLELFREYEWVPRGGPVDSTRESQRVIRFADGRAIAPGGEGVPSDAEAIRREGERLYGLLKEQEADGPTPST